MNANLSYMLSRMQGVSSQTFRLQPQNSTTATAHQQIRISLPSNTLLNLRSIKLLFRATTAGGAARLPAKIDSLIDSVRLECGGVTIDGVGLSSYGVLRHAKDALMGDKTDSVLGHPEMVRAKPYHNGGAAITGTNVESYGTDGDDFAICNWEGFIGSCEPSVIDTSLLPDLVLVIQLAGNEVLSSVAGVSFADYVTNGARGAAFTLQNIRMTCECLGLASGVYDTLISRAISERGMIELPFKQYFSTIDTHSGSTRFHVSSACLDRIWVCFRQQGYDTQKAPVAIKGYKITGAFTSSTSGGGVTQDIGAPQYELGGVLHTNGEKYRGAFHNMKFGANDVTCQFQLNGSLTPGFPATIPELYAMSKNAVDYSGEGEAHTLDQYRENFAVICHRLCLPGSGTRELAGTDSRGISLMGAVITTNVPPNTNVLVQCEVTSVLQIGANKQFSTVV